MDTIASVESITGGLFAARITARPGASRYFKGALVTYANSVKAQFGIDTSQGVINAKTALAMAQLGKSLFDVNTCVAFTGNAGPTALDSAPVGRVYIAINEQVFECDFVGDRKAVQEQAVTFALSKLNLD